MWKSNDQIRDSQISSQEDWKCREWNGKIGDSRTLSQENRKCEKFKWKNKRFTNVIRRKLKMLKNSNDKIASKTV